MKLKPKLTKDIATFELEWDGETIQFSAKRHCLVPDVMDLMKDCQEKPKQMGQALAGILTEWSIDDVSPTDADDINKTVPVELIGKMMEKIGETWAGKKQSPAPLASGSAA